MITNNQIRMALIAIASLNMFAASGQSNYQQANSNVSYGEVTELPYSPAAHEFSYGEDSSQIGRLWLANPAFPAGRSVIFIHGGCWLNQFDMKHTFPLASALAQAGFNVWSLEYRRTGDKGGGWPGSYNDVKAGIQYISALAEYKITIENSVIVGHSAGGHLALLAGQEFPSSKAVIGLAAITNVISYSQGNNSCETATPSFMGGTFQKQPSQYRAATPTESLLHNTTQLLHGSSDEIVNIQQSVLEGAETEILQDAGHFDWVHPGTTAFNLFLNKLEALF
ncbi:MAG: alpha/beta fold hydrolase [Pseudohongiellaceae bacterium]